MSGALPEHIDDIEAFYKDNLQNLEVPPSMDLWERIDAALPAEKLGSVAQEPITQFSKPLWWGGAGIGLVAVALVVYWAVSTPQQEVQTPKKESQQNDTTTTHNPPSKNNIAPATIPTITNVEDVKKQKDNKPVLNDATNETQVQTSEQQSPNITIEEPKSEALVQQPVPQVHVDTAAIQQKAETPISKEDSKKTMHEKLKEKNKNKANDLFIKKKE